MLLKLNVNGQQIEVEAAEGMPLLWVLRDKLKLTGTKYGCGVASCGACTVHVDGVPVRSCVMSPQNLADAEITTIEGLSSRPGRAVQQAWAEHNVVQCGYCQSGQIMSAAGLLAANSSPDVSEIETHMSGNVCRCATYQRIRSAVARAAEILKEESQ
ncbi:MAG: (2Fe-2S)-binding protein [Gammaproteobacteria bacterium]|nr:(2Fe-2S)-binding protein [Gammaproteobacteria bacterium]MCY4228179.1 (2Fe-2S)-binding protein [Gammaproteobacteria bacterium]MCY4312457.1 (2Fe-2S)-binding protein [Gammaproteobacteria bacterium]